MSGEKKTINEMLAFLIAKENRLGAIILLVGVVAIIIVLGMALSRLGARNASVEAFYAQEETIQKPPEYVRQVEPEKPKYNRQTDITVRQIIGAWEVTTNKGRALLQLNDGTYKFALINIKPEVSNLYSMGTYQLRDDVITFTPNTNLAQGQKEFPNYRILTRSSFPVFVARKGSDLIFQKPDRSVGIYVPPVHPLLRLMPDNVAVFEQLK